MWQVKKTNNPAQTIQGLFPHDLGSQVEQVGFDGLATSSRTWYDPLILSACFSISFPHEDKMAANAPDFPSTFRPMEGEGFALSPSYRTVTTFFLITP